MRKLENFQRTLDVLRSADVEMARRDEVYRMGVIGTFSLCFELAWKALQAALRAHGVAGAETGSPREILKLGVSVGFVEDGCVWIDMMRDRNIAAHMYRDDVDDLTVRVLEVYAPALAVLANTIAEKFSNAAGGVL